MEFSAPILHSWFLKGLLPTEWVLGMLVKVNILNAKGKLLDVGYIAEMSQKGNSLDLWIEYSKSIEDP